MTRAREAARLIGNNTFRLDSNNAVGFNSTTPDAMFDINSGLTVAGILTATGGFSGAASQVTVADESTDTTCFPLFVTAATGDLAPKSGSNLTFNSNTGTLETTNVTVTGDLTVQGTTTTLDTDLIGVDKVEVGANNSTVGLAVTQSGSGAIIAAYDGASEVFRVDDGGSVGVGTATPTNYGGAVKLAVSSASNTSVTIASGTSSDGTILFADSTSGDATYRGQVKYSHSSDAMLFNTAATERLRIDSSGRLLVTGGNTSLNVSGFQPNIQVAGTAADSSALMTGRFGDNASAPFFIFHKSRNASINGNTVVANNDILGRVAFYGADGTDYEEAAHIQCQVDGTPNDDATDMPGRLVFATTADGDHDATERLRITSAGVVRIPDGGKLSCGTNDDLEIEHTGSGSFIRTSTSSTGDLAIEARNGADLYLSAADDVFIRPQGSENGIKVIGNGATELYYDNSKMFETTSTGALVSRSSGDVSLSVGDTSNSDGHLILTAKSSSLEIHSRSNHQINFLFNTVTKASIGTDGTISDDIGPLRRLGTSTKSSDYTLVAGDAGKAIIRNGGNVTVPNSVFSAGDMVTIVNNTTTDMTVTQGSSFTLYNSADGTTGNKTQSARSTSTILFASSSVGYISGTQLS